MNLDFANLSGCPARLYNLRTSELIEGRCQSVNFPDATFEVPTGQALPSADQLLVDVEAPTVHCLFVGSAEFVARSETADIWKCLIVSNPRLASRTVRPEPPLAATIVREGRSYPARIVEIGANRAVVAVPVPMTAGKQASLVVERPTGNVEIRATVLSCDLSPDDRGRYLSRLSFRRAGGVLVELWKESIAAA